MELFRQERQQFSSCLVESLAEIELVYKFHFLRFLTSVLFMPDVLRYERFYACF